MQVRAKLSWVTALTVASLLLGGGALNALADEHGNHGHGHGPPPTITHDQDADDVTTSVVTEEIRPGLGCGDADDHSGAPGNPDLKCSHPHDNDGDASAEAGHGHGDNDHDADNDTDTDTDAD
jgi:hypothetical protein